MIRRKSKLVTCAFVALVLFWSVPASARFLSVDPKAGKYPSVSPYVYVRNNPILRLDLAGLTDIKFTVYRTTETKNSTMGNYKLTNNKDSRSASGATIEKPWNNNKVDKSRIPAGSYNAYLRTSAGTFNYPRLTLTGVPGRTGIVVHRGNTAADTKGCIIVGKTAGDERVDNPSEATTEISDYIQTIQAEDEESGEETTITVEVIDPPEDDEEEEAGTSADEGSSAS